MFLSLLGYTHFLLDFSLRRLAERIYAFYENEVRIDSRAMQHANDMVWSVNNAFYNYIKEVYNVEYPVGEFTISGSVSEGLKVCEPNEFDMIITIILSEHKAIKVIKESPGIAKFEFLDAEHQSHTDNKWFNMTVTETRYQDHTRISHTAYLSPQKIAEKMKQIMLEAIDSSTFRKNLHPLITRVEQAKVHQYEFGPTSEFKITFQAIEGYSTSTFVDYVPIVHMLDDSHVINPCYRNEDVKVKAITSDWGTSHIDTFYGDPTLYWRINYSGKEKATLDLVGEKGKTPLRVYKGLVLCNKHLKNPVFGSYHMKNVFLMLAFEHSADMKSCCSKKSETIEEFSNRLVLSNYNFLPLSRQIIEMTKHIYHFVKNGSMPWVFHQHIQMTFEMRDKKKSELFDVPKIQKEMTEYL